MPLFTIDPKKCRHDGICVAECPRGIIEMKPGEIPTPSASAEALCTLCGHCVAVCPYGALTHTKLPSEEFAPILPEHALTFGQGEQFLRARRSIRAYKDKPVDRNALENLIGAARYAPTGTNSQLVSWKVIASRAGVKKLGNVAIDMMRDMAANNHPLAVRYQFGAMATNWDAGIDGLTRGAPALVIAHAPKEYGLAQVDCTSALAYFDLMAPTLGLGTCWGGFLMIAAAVWPPFQTALALPEGHASFGIMMAGYPKYRYRLLPPRKAPGITWME